MTLDRDRLKKLFKSGLVMWVPAIRLAQLPCKTSSSLLDRDPTFKPTPAANTSRDCFLSWPSVSAQIIRICCCCCIKVTERQGEDRVKSWGWEYHDRKKSAGSSPTINFSAAKGATVWFEVSHHTTPRNLVLDSVGWGPDHTVSYTLMVSWCNNNRKGGRGP